MGEIVKIFSDGSCDNNSELRPMTVGVAIFKYGQMVESYGDYIRSKGNSYIAEWWGFQSAMEMVVARKQREGLRSEKYIFYSDAMTLVKQYNGEWRIRKPEFLEMWKDIKELEAQLEGQFSELIWIPRALNTAADKLAGDAQKEYQNIFRN